MLIGEQAYTVVSLTAPYGPDTMSGTVLRRTDFDDTIVQCVVSDRNLARAIPIIRHQTLSDSAVKVYLLP